MLSRNNNGDLYIGQHDLKHLACQYGTPLYVYSKQALTENAQAYLNACSKGRHYVFYAVKANASLAILSIFARLGCGFDIVSGGELYMALAAGAEPSKIVYSGVGKTNEEIAFALEKKIRCFNIESIAELDRIQAVAQKMNVIAPVAIRVNPNVDPKTHPYISTGLKSTKFGVAYTAVIDLYKKARQLPNLHISGIDCHIGSQITEISPFEDAAHKVFDIVDQLKTEGIVLDHVDFGGGLGVNYLPSDTPPAAGDLVQTLSLIASERGYPDIELFFEPGRSLVATAGVLLTQVVLTKETETKSYCIVDAGMNDMIRPSLYQAEMAILNASCHPSAEKLYDVVGPICESGDWLGKDRMLAVEPGDTLVMTHAGAYGFSMSSNYNCRRKPAEVLLDECRSYLIRERENYQDLLRNQTKVSD